MCVGRRSLLPQALRSGRLKRGVSLERSGGEREREREREWEREGVMEAKVEEGIVGSSRVKGSGAEEEEGEKRGAAGRMAGAMQILPFTSTLRLNFSYEMRVVCSNALALVRYAERAGAMPLGFTPCSFV